MPDDLTPSGNANGFCELRFFNPALYLQTFQTHQLVFLNHFCALVVLEVFATVSNCGVNSGNLQCCLEEIRRALLLRLVFVGVFRISTLYE